MAEPVLAHVFPDILGRVQLGRIRLQAEQPGVYPDGQLRTLQRRLKDWRREIAHKMVFGTEAAGAASGQAPLSSNVCSGLYALVS
jgi:hypothetical protein